MRKIFLFFFVFIIGLCIFTPKVIFADSNGFDVILPEDEYLYDGNQKDYKLTPNVNHVQIEYIESTGEQAINTKIKASSDNGFEIDMVLLSNGVWAHIIGAANAWDSKWHNGVIFNAVNISNTAEITINDNSHPTPVYQNRFSGFYPNTRYTISFVNHQFNVEGVLPSSVDLTGKNAPAMYDWYLFATNDHDTNPSGSGNTKMRLYGCKLYEGTTEARNYIPVVVTKDQPKEKNSDDINSIPAGTVCLYDQISGKYFLNVGTGNFIPGIKLNGETYKILESIKSSGSQHIDTGYDADLSTEWIIDYQFLEYDKQIGGGDIENYKRFCLANGANGNKIYFCLGDVSISSFNSNLDRHIYVLDGPNKRGLVDGDIVASTLTTSISPKARLQIFDRNTSSYIHKANLFSSKIFDNGNIVRNYIPVKRDSDGKCGLYDLINDQFILDSTGNSFTAGNYDNPIGEDFCKVDKKTNAGEYIFYPLSNLANALYIGNPSNFEKVWKIDKIELTPYFDAYYGVFDRLEHPLSFIEVKNQNNEIVDTSKYTIKYYIDESHSTEISMDDINANNSNFIDVGTHNFYYVLTPTDTVNYEGLEGQITVCVYSASKKAYRIPNTGV